MVNVYEAVDANKRRSWVVIAAFVFFVVLASVFIAQALSYYYGSGATNYQLTGLAIIFSGVMSFVSFYFSDQVILAISGATVADRKNYFQFYTVAENLSLASSIPMPKLYVINDTAMNAFATGRDPQHAVICATTGLLETLNRTELEGVIAHEVSHITNFDTRLMSIVTVLIGIVTLLGDWLVRSTWWGRGNRNRDENGNLGAILFAVGLIFALLSPIISQLIQLAISRRRELLADASAVKLTRQPGGLINALKKLDTDKEPLEAANKATAHLYIVNPLKNRSDTIGWFSGLFNTHPPITERIKLLEQMA
jgi:heat shock protein HtpX